MSYIMSPFGIFFFQPPLGWTVGNVEININRIGALRVPSMPSGLYVISNVELALVV